MEGIAMNVGWTGLAAVLLVASAAFGGGAPRVESDVWLNGPRLAPSDLAGKVVLVEFWTFGCINCVRTVPAMRELHRVHKDKGLLVVGVHSPEFDRERDVEAVRKELLRLDISYPVAIDNDLRNWKAFGNRYWPALYLMDKSGSVRHRHVGELHEGTRLYLDLEEKIEALLRE
jgi:thiol-disulfide isomerase/thioredoxin